MSTMLISSMSKDFNDIMRIDHFFLDSVRLLHFMDLATLFIYCVVASSASSDDRVFVFEACWISQFWHPESVQGNFCLRPKELQELSR